MDKLKEKQEEAAAARGVMITARRILAEDPDVDVPLRIRNPAP